MSDIDEVIARSKAKGTFSERQTFTIERKKAIEKMRRFALVDPHHYILELIIGAIGNGARYLDLRVGEDELGISYVGGHYSRLELSQVFDFMFASQGDRLSSSIRSLAIGLNALLLFEPKEIVVESGDGSAASATRVRIVSAESALEIGTPEAPVAGTFIRALGLKRKTRRRLGLQAILTPFDPVEPPECDVIRERCLAAPVPFLLNGEAPFGYATMRSPNLLGYVGSQRFDEGDLYGAIGMARAEVAPELQLLMHGVHVDTIALPFGAYAPRVGGIAAFDGLRRTADHAKVVRDDVFAQVMDRLRLYADRVRRGERAQLGFGARLFGESFALTPRRLRELLVQAKGLVMVPRGLEPSSARARVAIEIARALDALLIEAEPGERGAVRSIAPPGLVIVEPELDDADEVRFYLGPVLDASVEGALLAKPHEPPAFTMDVAGVERARVQARVLQPVAAVESRARVIIAERLVWEGPAPIGHAGVTLELRVSGMGPSALRRSTGEVSEASMFARRAAVELREEIAKARGDVARSMSPSAVRPRTAGAHVVLHELARTSFLRIDREGRARFVVPFARREILTQSQPLACLDGTKLDLEGIEALLAKNEGLLYGVVPEVAADLDGLDPSAILELDHESERALVGAVGAGAYVRLDAREPLFSVDGFALRELAPYSSPRRASGLCVEAGVPEKVLATLAERLLDHVAPADIPHRRRALLRHRMHLLVRGHGRLASAARRLRDVPLFAADGGTVTYRELMSAPRTLWMCEGRAMDPPTAAARVSDGEPLRLLMNPFVASLLAPRRRVRGTLEIRPNASLAPGAEGDYLVCAEVTHRGVSGEIGVPRAAPEHLDVAVLGRDGRHARSLSRLAREHGVVGRIYAKETRSISDPQLLIAARDAAVTALDRLIDALPKLEDETRARAEQILLEHAGMSFTLSRSSSGAPEWTYRSSVAERVFALPLFPIEGKNPTSAARLLEGALHDEPWRLDPELAPHLRSWLERHRGEVLELASTPSQAVLPADAPEPELLERRSLSDRLTTMLQELVPGVRIAVIRPEGAFPQLIKERAWSFHVLGDQRSRTLYVNAADWRAVAAMLQPERKLPFLALACFAHLNARFESPTNADELALQRKILAKLR